MGILVWKSVFVFLVVSIYILSIQVLYAINGFLNIFNNKQFKLGISLQYNNSTINGVQTQRYKKIKRNKVYRWHA